MITRLYIQNFALIDRIEINFFEGLNIITGETGAGKSILLGAMGLILGKRADSNSLVNDEKCIVEAEFYLEDPEKYARKFSNLDESGLTLQDSIDWQGNQLIIRREITKAGKSRAFINDSPVNLNTLKSITDVLIDIHGQHDGQLLMDEEAQLQILDQYAKNIPLTQEFSKLLSELRSIDRKIKELKTQDSEARRQIDFYKFQIDELLKAELSINEENQIESELKLLENAELIAESIHRTTYELVESEQSVIDQLSGMLKNLEKVANLHEPISEECHKIQEAKSLLDDVALELQRLGSNMDLDPKRLEFLNERNDVYNKLKLKYGVRTTSELLNLLDDFSAKVEVYDSIDQQIADLQFNSKRVSEELIQKGLEIERIRKDAASQLSQNILKTLQEIGLNKTQLKIEIKRVFSTQNDILKIENENVQPNNYGINTVSFRVKTNEGLPWGQLSQIASGGEISRVMLAIKSALADKMELSSLVFDEIDTGISGEIAMKVGRVMANLALKHQIIVITHLPQIASRGHDHFFIFKEIKGNRTISNIKKLSVGERMVEIAKMISGDKTTETALRSAQELLETI